MTYKALAHTSFVCEGKSSVAKASHVTYLNVLLPFPGSNQSTELLPLVAAEDIAVAHFGAAWQCVTKKQCMKRACTCRRVAGRMMSPPPFSRAEPPENLENIREIAIEFGRRVLVAAVAYPHQAWGIEHPNSLAANVRVGDAGKSRHC